MYYVVDKEGRVVGLYETRWEAKVHQRELNKETMEKPEEERKEKPKDD